MTLPAFCELLDREAFCRLFGGTRPLHPATLYRGIRQARFPKPVKVGPGTSRWLREECEAVLRGMVEGKPSMTTPTPTISTTDTRSLPQLATEINRVHKLFCVDKKTSFERATEIGQMLSRAKHLNGNHGDWLEWLHRSCPDISDRTAQLYMRLGKPENAKKLEEAAEANTQRVADLSVRVAQQVLAKPKTDGTGGKTPRARKAAVEAASAAVTLSPDLKDLLQSTAPDGLVTALKEANWNVEQSSGANQNPDIEPATLPATCPRRSLHPAKPATLTACG